MPDRKAGHDSGRWPFDSLDAGARERSGRLRKRFQDGDLGALVEVLVSRLGSWMSAYPKEMEEEYNRFSVVKVEKWALLAALCYALRSDGVRVEGIALPKRGSSGRWTRRISRELDDLRVFRAVREARKAIPNREDAIADVAERQRLSEWTVKASYERAQRLLRADPARYDVLEKFISSITAPRKRSPGKRKAAK